LFLFALAIRFLYLLQSSDNPTFDTPVVDALKHHQLAREIAGGAGLDELFRQRRPFFYPLFLTTVYSLFGPSILAAKVVQAVVGAGTCVLTWWLGVRVFGRPVGLLAGIIVACYGPLFFWELELVAAGWAAFWSVALMALILRTADAPTPLHSGLLGLCGALAIMTRPGFLLFFAAACTWLVATGLRAPEPRRLRVLGFTALLMGFSLAAGPISLASLRTTGRAALLPAAGGLNAYLGNNPKRCETLALRPGAEIFDLAERPLHADHRSVAEQSRFFYARVRDYALDNPSDFAAGLAIKAGEFAGGREVPRNVDLYVFREWSGLLGVTTWRLGGLGFPWGVLLPLALVGVVWRWREIPIPMRLFAVLYPLLPILVFVASRHRIPVVPIFSIFAAAAAWSIFEALREQRWGAAVVATAAGGALTALACAIPPACGESASSRSELYSYLGTGAFNAGLPDRARHYADEALAEARPSHLAHELMAWILVQEDDDAGAIAHLDISLQTRRSSWPLILRGRAHMNRDDLERAEQDLDAALTLRPTHAGALLLRGDVHYRRAQLAQARRRWELAAAQGGTAGRRAEERLSELERAGRRRAAGPDEARTGPVQPSPSPSTNQGWATSTE